MNPSLRILDARPARDPVGRKATVVRVGPADGIYTDPRATRARIGPVADWCLLPHHLASWAALTAAIRDRMGPSFHLLRPAPGDVPGLPPEALA